MQDHLKDRNEQMTIILILLVFIYLFLGVQLSFSLISSMEINLKRIIAAENLQGDCEKA